MTEIHLITIKIVDPNTKEIKKTFENINIDIFQIASSFVGIYLDTDNFYGIIDYNYESTEIPIIDIFVQNYTNNIEKTNLINIDTISLFIEFLEQYHKDKLLEQGIFFKSKEKLTEEWYNNFLDKAFENKTTFFQLLNLANKYLCEILMNLLSIKLNIEIDKIVEQETDIIQFIKDTFGISITNEELNEYFENNELYYEYKK